MKPKLLPHLCLRVLPSVFLVGATAACNDPFSLGPATIENRVDTTSIRAVSVAQIGEPNAYDIVQRTTVVTELGETFDFVFDLRNGEAQLLPMAALGLSGRAGIRLMNKTFDEIKRPPDSDYVTDEAVTVRVGDVFVGRSRSATTGCSFLGSISRFGKFEVLGVDQTTGDIRLKILVNSNCGFRDLEPGLPRN